MLRGWGGSGGTCETEEQTLRMKRLHASRLAAQTWPVQEQRQHHPGTLLQMQNLRPQPRPTGLESAFLEDS